MKVFVIAMESEAECVRQHLDPCREETIFGRRVIRGQRDGEDVLIVLAGIGKSNAAAATQLALSLAKPDTIYNVGLAGGCDKDMAIGDIYEVADAVQYDFDLSLIDGTAIGTLSEFDTPFLPCHPLGRCPAKRLATGDRFTNRADDLAFLASLGAGLRDMEGAAIAHVCARAGVRLVSYKCVCDLLWRGEPTHEYELYSKKCLAILADFMKTFS